MNQSESINVYYDGIIERANELNDLADRLLSMVNNEISDNTELVRRSWDGDSGDLYVKKVNDTACRIRSRARDLKSTSENLRTSAERMRKADLWAVSILGG